MRTPFPLSWQPFRDAKFSLLLLALLIPVVFLIFFLIGFFVSFPDTVLQNRVVREINRLLPAGNSFEADTVSFGFPLQLQIDQARLTLAHSPLPELQLSRVRLSPTLATLIGRPGLAIQAESEFGALDGSLHLSGEVDLHLRAGEFNFPFVGMPNLQIEGMIKAVDLVGQMQLNKDEPMQLQALVDNLLLRGADQLGLGQTELALGTLSLQLAGSGRSQQIEQLSLSGGVVTVNGTGKIVVQQPIAASGLDLKLNLKPEASANSGLRTMLELLGPVGNDGAHQIQLRGRLFAPQLK